MNKDRIRNWLNIIFMVGAVVGVIMYLQKNEQTHMMGLYIILCSMVVKVAESPLRMMKRWRGEKRDSRVAHRIRESD